MLLVVSMIAFGISGLLPGDPALAMLGEERSQDRELYQLLRQELGLDQPVPIQYATWLGRTLRGDFGLSARNQKPVSELILDGLVPTAQLALSAMLLGIAVALPVGLISAVRPNSWADMLGTLLALSGVAVPHFLLGILLLFLFAIWIPVLPAGGYVAPDQDPGES